jgi:hypothetical protein
LTSLVEFQTLYNGILYKNYLRRAVCFYTHEKKSRSSTFLYTKHLARPLANFAPVMKGVKCPTVPQEVQAVFARARLCLPYNEGRKETLRPK